MKVYEISGVKYVPLIELRNLAHPRYASELASFLENEGYKTYTHKDLNVETVKGRVHNSKYITLACANAVMDKCPKLFAKHDPITSNGFIYDDDNNCFMGLVALKKKCTAVDKTLVRWVRVDGIQKYDSKFVALPKGRYFKSQYCCITIKGVRELINKHEQYFNKDFVSQINGTTTKKRQREEVEPRRTPQKHKMREVDAKYLPLKREFTKLCLQTRDYNDEKYEVDYFKRYIPLSRAVVHEARSYNVEGNYALGEHVEVQIVLKNSLAWTRAIVIESNVQKTSYKVAFLEQFDVPKEPQYVSYMNMREFKN